MTKVKIQGKFKNRDEVVLAITEPVEEKAVEERTATYDVATIESFIKGFDDKIALMQERRAGWQKILDDNKTKIDGAVEKKSPTPKE